MSITRFFPLLAFAAGAAQIACAGVIPTPIPSASLAGYPSLSSTPSGDAPAATDIPQGPSNCSSMISADGPASTDLPTDIVDYASFQPDTASMSASAYPSGTPVNASASTNLPQDAPPSTESSGGFNGYPGSLSQPSEFSSTAVANGAAPTDMPQNTTTPTGSGNPPSLSQGGIPSGCPTSLPSVVPNDVAAPSDLPNDALASNYSAGSIPQGCPTAFPSSALPSGGPEPTDAA